MKRRTLKTITILGVALALVAISLFAYNNTRKVDEQLHINTLNEINRLKSLIANLNFTLLELRYYKSLHYDDLNEIKTQLNLAIENINRYVHETGTPKDHLIFSKIETTKASIESEQKNVDLFKSRNSTFRNSSLYFPQLIDEISEELIVKNRETSKNLNFLLQNVLIYQIFPDAQHRSRVNQTLALIANDKYLQDYDAEAIAIIHDHALLIINQKPELDALMDSLLNHDGLLQISELEESYLTLFNQMAATDERNRKIQYLIILLSSLALLAMGREIFRRARALRRANTSLEIRVNERTADLKRSNKELEEFAYVASHDLKAPLRAVSTLASFIEEDLGSDLNEDTRDHMLLLKSRIVRMENLINGILSYSKAGKTKLEMVIFPVSQEIDESIKGLNFGDNYQSHISMDKNVSAYGNTVMFSQVIANIAGNAIKYHDKDHGNVWIRVTEQPGQLKVEISDDGAGIPNQYHDTVFGIFKTLQARDEKESTGIGLSIVKKIIESMGGTIWVENNAPRGAKFCFTWPTTKGTKLNPSTEDPESKAS